LRKGYYLKYEKGYGFFEKRTFLKKCGPFAYENWALIKFGAAFGQ
jgi:hypothetical protein